MHDLVIRNGTIVDGTGRARFRADVGVQEGVIAEVGPDCGPGKREIDADGLLVTPGFVDIHTHYDGQATWDSMIAPSSWHGVTSVLMGNCGVGFAPARPDKHDFLISLMEGVEDIPGTALAEGLTWDWESFPEYLDALDRRPHVVDIGAQMPHAPLRAYVMGERGADHQIDPTADEIARMSQLTAEALAAGAIGFATSRTVNHKSRDGVNIGSLTASSEELLGIGAALKAAGRGVFQLISDFLTTADIEFEFSLMRRMAADSGRPLSVSLFQTMLEPERWRIVLDLLEGAAAEGVEMKAQICGRPIGLLLGLQGSLNPLMLAPSYQPLAGLPLAERVARLRDPQVRSAIIEECREGARVRMSAAAQSFAPPLDRVFPLGEPPEYEPAPDDSIQARAERAGVEPAALLYDLLLQRDGEEMLYFPVGNYNAFNLEVARQMILSERALFGLSDGGAHVGTISDGSFPTYNVLHWARDRKRGDQLPLELVVKRQTSDTAFHVGWLDRGVVAPGYKADLNVIDFENLALEAPQVSHDLPAGGRRLLQKARGYRYTICSGQVTFEDGEHTGVLPGRLIRGSRRPAARLAEAVAT